MQGRSGLWLIGLMGCVHTSGVCVESVDLSPERFTVRLQGGGHCDQEVALDRITWWDASTSESLWSVGATTATAPGAVVYGTTPPGYYQSFEPRPLAPGMRVEVGATGAGLEGGATFTLNSN